MGILERARVEWFAAAFGLVVGITMVFVPYEFGAAIFQLIYPYVRPLGSLFLVGSATMLAAMLYPTWPPFVGWLGRALFLAAVAFYWWAATVLPRGLTGFILYPLIAGLLLLERTRRFQGRGLLPVFIACVALSFGGLMVLVPSSFVRMSLLAFGPFIRLMGGAFLATGGLLAVGLWRGHEKACRIAAGSLSVLFLSMTLALGSRRSWAGMGVYAVLSLACLLLWRMRQLPALSGVRWRLFRGMALASVLPILCVGAVTSYVAQRAISAELRDKARQAVLAETAWLEQSAAMARALLRSQSRDPGFIEAVRTGDHKEMSERVELLTGTGLFDATWLLDASGETLVPSDRLNRFAGNYANREYFQQAVSGGDEVWVSRPFLTRAGLPFIVLSTRVDLGDGQRAVLVGGLSLQRLGLQSTLASRSYHVELFDRRDGILLRDTDLGGVLTRAPVLGLLPPDALAAPEGVREAFDESGSRLLVAHAQVPDTEWTVVVTARLREAFAPVTRMGGWVVAIAALAGAISLLLSQWVGRDVAVRLETLRDGFAALGTPAGEQRVQARGDDEVAQLTDGFNDMAARIDRTQQELREAIAIRDQFLSMASHELRTPLTPLKATLELLIRQSESGVGLTPERQRASFQRLTRQVDRLTRLIGDMLDVSRLQSGRFALAVAPMDLTALAREVLERIQSTRPERQGWVSLDVPDGPLVGRWDEQRLDQLLTNLVENALRYSPPGTPVCMRVREEDGRVRVDVEDRGIGIPRESLPQLFTPFFRARNATEHYAGGLGLGLAICREIVERHGGRIQASSEGSGKGTCFTVWLPRAAIADAA
ncbi:ATP-binding protein [Corallococcus sp. CA049B]|uniref:ATP-binding protein n=1 Tax=Corallococcus sp. CA049B TaxID=2316730 RepID=UPI00351A65BF